MNVGVGLPNAVPATPGELLVEWSSRADEGPFSSLGVVDRMRYDSFDPMTTLAAAAAVTRRVGLVTMVVIGPLRNSAVLAKQAATIDALSGGRLTLGLGVGARADDYETSGIPARGRGERLTDQLLELRRFWENDGVGPAPARPAGPQLLVGGSDDLAFLRMARYADGYVHGGGPPKTFARAAEKARTAWTELARPGEPQMWAQAYFALGDGDAVERGRAYMLDYYAFTGPFAERIAQGLLTTPQSIAQYVRSYAQEGCGELVLLPAVAEIDQLDRLQDALAEA